MSESKSHKTHKDPWPPLFHIFLLMKRPGQWEGQEGAVSFWDLPEHSQDHFLKENRYASKNSSSVFFFSSSLQAWRPQWTWVMYPGPSCRSLRIFRHLMNSFGVLSWFDSGTGKEGVHPLTISVTHLHLFFYHRGGSPGILRFNYFYIKFDWQVLETFSALVDCLNTIPPGIVRKLHS